MSLLQAFNSTLVIEKKDDSIKKSGFTLQEFTVRNSEGNNPEQQDNVGFLPMPKRLAFIEDEDKLMESESNNSLPFTLAKTCFNEGAHQSNQTLNQLMASLHEQDDDQTPLFGRASDYLEKDFTPPQNFRPSYITQYNQQAPVQNHRQSIQLNVLSQQQTPNQSHNGVQIQPPPISPVHNNSENMFKDCQPNYMTYSPVPVTMPRTPLIYPTIPEYGFTSKIFSSQKKKKFVPSTPTKKNIRASRPSMRPLGNALFAASRFTQQIQQTDEYDIYSNMARMLSLSETLDSNGCPKLNIQTIPLKTNRFLTDFENICKLGEGSFGEAFKVRSKLDGKLYAVKKAKDRYIGFKDREAKLQEVLKAINITQAQPKKRQSDEQSKGSINEENEEEEEDEFYRGHCVKVFCAWEESGYLYIQSELCEKGNLNDYLNDLSRSEQAQKIDPGSLWPQIVTEDLVWKFLYEMTCALKNVHDRGFIHLDVKPSNFFVKQSGQLALGDFGQALQVSQIPKLKDDDVEGDSVFMAPELLQNNLSPSQKITTKADIFSLGASLLEIASGINLPQNGLMWQKLRQAGEGVIRFSPSAGRSLQLEQLINLMMEPDPRNRPTADEILLHPKIQKIMNSLKELSIPGSTTDQKVQLPSKRNLNLQKLHLQHSPMLEKFRNPSISCRSNNGPTTPQCNQSVKNEFILISPRILLSAQKSQNQNRKHFQRSDLSKRGASQERYEEEDACQIKRRRRSQIGSRSSSENHKMRERSRSIEFQDADCDESGCPISLRTVGKSESFNEKFAYPQTQTLFTLKSTSNPDNKQVSTSQSSKQLPQNLNGWLSKTSQTKIELPTITPLKSAKRLNFTGEEAINAFNHGTGDEDLKINEFSPNQEGPIAPLHSFQHNGIRKRLNIQQPTQTILEQADEIMTEDESNNRTSCLETNENPLYSVSNKTQYFGGYSAIGPSQKLQSQNHFKAPFSKQIGVSQFNRGDSFKVPQLDTNDKELQYQEALNQLSLQPPALPIMAQQFSFNDSGHNQSFGGGIRAFGSNQLYESNSGSASEISTPKLFRIQSNASGAHVKGGLTASNSGSLNGFQHRSSNITNIFEQRQSNITFCDQRPQSNTSFFDQRASNSSAANDYLQYRSSNASNFDSQIPAEHTLQTARFSNKTKPFQLRISPKLIGWAEQSSQQQQSFKQMEEISQLQQQDPYFSQNDSNFQETTHQTQDSLGGKDLQQQLLFNNNDVSPFLIQRMNQQAQETQQNHDTFGNNFIIQGNSGASEVRRNLFQI